ncbi:unnamed protein product [Darwinula stevensoni]|uniref:MOG interacting and ectopic P-granules protein 1 n=1 Tax=Darwinula stevensoni TaxID=69355 RepID=A0A7R8XMP7_9CRUS|nr:unnamed protein product [Darwinula stevensoni]CAG0895813.1 unnamed protein product [Darwinula stevensoni]
MKISSRGALVSEKVILPDSASPIMANCNGMRNHGAGNNEAISGNEVVGSDLKKTFSDTGATSRMEETEEPQGSDGSCDPLNGSTKSECRDSDSSEDVDEDSKEDEEFVIETSGVCKEKESVIGEEMEQDENSVLQSSDTELTEDASINGQVDKVNGDVEERCSDDENPDQEDIQRDLSDMEDSDSQDPLGDDPLGDTCKSDATPRDGSDVEMDDDKIETNESDSSDEDLSGVDQSVSMDSDISNDKAKSTTPSSTASMVVVDTSAIIAGRGPVPLNKVSGKVPSDDMNFLIQSSAPKILSDQQHLDDESFVVEAPSFVVPYIYEKPCKAGLVDFVKKLREELKLEKPEPQAKALDEAKVQVEKKKAESTSDLSSKASESDQDAWKKGLKEEHFFTLPVGMFLFGLGEKLVQEYVQHDLLKMQKRKADKQGKAASMELLESIKNLSHNVKDTKGQNIAFHFSFEKCKFCSFRTDSAVVMAHHMEVPHMLNYTYKCNFCPYETRSPPEVIFHVEAEHNVRARLERGLFPHQCPFCPWEDGNKTKFKRHILACEKRFKPSANLCPPLDWEPPAKISRIASRGRPSLLGPHFAPDRMGPFGGASASRFHPLVPKAQAQAANAMIAAASSQRGRPRSGPIIATIPPRPLLPQGKMSLISTPSGFLYSRPSMTQPPLVLPPGSPFGPLPSSYPLPSGTSPHLFQMVGGQMVPISSTPRLALIPSNAGITSSSSTSNLKITPTPSVTLMPSAARPPAKAAPSRTNLPATLPSSLTIQTVKDSRGSGTSRLPQQPSISITPLPRNAGSSRKLDSVHGKVDVGKSIPSGVPTKAKPGQPAATFVICEICDGYIKDLEQLRNHMQWIHKVKIHPKMIHNRPPLNCQKCQFRFFTDQGLERHLLGSHGLVTSSMQEAANRGQDSGRCPICGKVYQWKLLVHVSKDHKVTLKPAHLSYKCTVCTATFSMYRLFEQHVYSAHSLVAKKVSNSYAGKKVTSTPPPQVKTSSARSSPSGAIKINNEITIIPQPKGAPDSSSNSSSTSTTTITTTTATSTTITATTTTSSATTTPVKHTCKECKEELMGFSAYVDHWREKHLGKASAPLSSADKRSSDELNIREKSEAPVSVIDLEKLRKGSETKDTLKASPRRSLGADSKDGPLPTRKSERLVQRSTKAPTGGDPDSGNSGS